MNVEVEGMKRVYITSHVEDHERLCRIRNEIWSTVDSIGLYRKVNPHITIVPPFYIPEEKMGVVDEALDRIDIEGKSVNIQNFKVWPDLSESTYLMLNVDVDMRDEQLSLVDDLRDSGAEYMKTPVSPHITMMKSNREWSEPPDDVKRRIQSTVGDYNDLKDTKIESVEPVIG